MSLRELLASMRVGPRSITNMPMKRVRRFGVQARTRIMNQLQAGATGAYHQTGQFDVVLLDGGSSSGHSSQPSGMAQQVPSASALNLPQHPQPESWLSLAGKRVVDEPHKNAGVQKQLEVVHQ